jgi:hypothetical protein
MFEHSSGDFERPPYSARCKFCGKAEFEWEMRGPQWKLTCRDGSIHDCRAISKMETTTPTPREQELEAQNKALWELVGDVQHYVDLLDLDVRDDVYRHDIVLGRKRLRRGLAAIQKAKESH